MTGLFRGLAGGVGVALLLCLGGPAAAQVKDPAELAPATTLAYFELSHPDKLAGELQTILKGSMLNDMPKFMAQMRARSGDDGRHHMGIMGPEMMFTPEVFAEFGRIQGGFLAITGIGKGHPDMVAVVLSGSSNVPTFIMRMYLTADSSVRAKSEVEGVTVYCHRHADFRKFEKDFRKDEGPRDRPPQPEMREDGPYMALLPDAIVIGTRETDVADVIRRMKGKNADASLASVRGFKESSSLRDLPGVFAYVDLTALVGRVDDALKGGREAEQWSTFKKLINTEAFKSAAGSWSLKNGDVAFQFQLHLDPKQTSPLLELLPSGKASLDPLQFCPPDALLAFSVNMDDGEKRFKKFVEVMDEVAASNLFGGRRKDDFRDRKDGFNKDGKEREERAPADRPGKPSEHIALIEKHLGLELGKDVFGKISNLGVVMSWGKEPPSDPSKMFAMVATAADADAAKALEETVLPKLVMAANDGNEVKPTKDRILDIPVTAYPVGRGMAIYCGRQGKTLVVGMDGKLVASCLFNGSKGEGLLKDARVAAAVKGQDDAIVVGTVNMGQVFKGMMYWVSMEQHAEPARDRPVPRDFPKDARPQDKPDFIPRPVDAPLPKDLKRLDRVRDKLPMDVIRPPIEEIKPPRDLSVDDGSPAPVRIKVQDKPATTAPIRIKPEDKPATTAPIRIRPGDDKPATTAPIRIRPDDDKPDIDGGRNRDKPPPDRPGGFDGPRDRPGAPPRDRIDPEAEKFMKEMNKILDDIPPAVVLVRRKPDLLTLEVRQPEFSKHAGKLIDFAMLMGIQTVRTQEKRFREEERRDRERFEELRPRDKTSVPPPSIEIQPVRPIEVQPVRPKDGGDK